MEKKSQVLSSELGDSLLQLDRASLSTNQLSHKRSKTATQSPQHSHRTRLHQVPTSKSDNRSTFQASVAKVSRQAAKTFPHTALRQTSLPPLRSFKPQSTSLWNPTNTSAIHPIPSKTELANARNYLSLVCQTRPLTCCPELSPENRAYLQRDQLQSRSSLKVEVSQSSNGPSSPKKSASSPHLLHPREQSNLGARSGNTLMSPHSSFHSDTPSKRPPTPAKDLEYGISNPPPPQSRSRTPSRHSPQASSTKSDLPWNPTHPCYPHPNPHIPLASPLHSTTRIIRIPRDWLIAGDLAPTFSNTYPEILEPWVSEADFRTLIKDINDRLIAAFSPYSWRAWADVLFGAATGWIWEDLGFAAVKSQVRRVEQAIEDWNGRRRKTLEKDEEGELVRAIPLNKTGYLCLDIQIPNPHVSMVENEEVKTEGNRSTVDEEEQKQS